MWQESNGYHWKSLHFSILNKRIKVKPQTFKNVAAQNLSQRQIMIVYNFRLLVLALGIYRFISIFRRQSTKIIADSVYLCKFVANTLWYLINVTLPLINLWPPKWSNFDLQWVTSWQVIMFYLDFFVTINSNVQTLILDLVSPP